jgi:hypothetical protein
MVAPDERRGLQPEQNAALAATLCELQDGQCRVLGDLVFFRAGATSYHAAKAWRDVSSDFVLIHTLRGTPESAASCQAVEKLLGQALVQVPKQSLATTAAARGSGNSSSSALSNCTASYLRTIDTRLLQPLTAVRARNVLAQIAGACTQVLTCRSAYECGVEVMPAWLCEDLYVPWEAYATISVWPCTVFIWCCNSACQNLQLLCLLLTCMCHFICLFTPSQATVLVATDGLNGLCYLGQRIAAQDGYETFSIRSQELSLAGSASSSMQRAVADFESALAVATGGAESSAAAATMAARALYDVCGSGSAAR